MEESNPWPTFVDAFSTVLCIFIFLMLVFVLNSMLIMYESAKKHYVPQVTAPIYSDKKMPDITSLPTETEAKEKNNHTELASNTSEAGRANLAQVAEAADAANAASAAEAASATEQADAARSHEQQAVAQAEGNAKHAPTMTPDKKSGNASSLSDGQFDIHEKTPAYEIKGNQFVIHFQKNEQGFPPEIIGKLKEWLKTEHKSASVNVYTNSNKSIAVSDAMRLAYQRGIMLLKVVKENDVNQDVAISVINDAGVMSNSAVITKVE